MDTTEHRENCSLGGKSTLHRHGVEHFAAAGTKGATAGWRKDPKGKAAALLSGRLRKVSSARRSEIGRIAALARWRKRDQKPDDLDRKQDESDEN